MPPLKSCVLLIDDVRETRSALATLLQQRGYATLEADTGEMGLRLLREHVDSVAIIVLDLLMPATNGWWFREQQLADPSIADVPVIVFTSAGKPELVKYTLRIQDVLFKPVAVDDLLLAIERHFREAR